MTDKDIIERVAKLFGKNCVEEKPSNPKNGSRLMQYRTYVGGGLALEWMTLLYPLLGSRRKKQIEKCFFKLGKEFP